MPLFFVTGNQGKFAEVQALIPEVQQLNVELDEIQELDPERIIKHKLEQALSHHQGQLLIEDTSLYCDGLGGLPGPFIKWFLKTLGPAGTAELVLRSTSTKAVAKTLIGYADADGNLEFFQGEVHGQIVAPRGERGFGWDSIFQPAGENKTFAEMTLEEKQRYSMRRAAVEKLKATLG